LSKLRCRLEDDEFFKIFGVDFVAGECVAGYVKGKGEVDVSEDEVNGEGVSEHKWGSTNACAGW
jgi:hypothetical protein